MPFGETGSQMTIFISKWRTSLGDAQSKVKQRTSALPGSWERGRPAGKRILVVASCNEPAGRRRSQEKEAWWHCHRNAGFIQPRLKASLQFFLRFVRHFDFGRVDVFDFHSGRAVNVAVIAVEAHGALKMKLEFREFAVFDPEFRRTLGVADGGRFTAANARPEGQQCLRAVLGQVAGD